MNVIEILFKKKSDQIKKEMWKKQNKFEKIEITAKITKTEIEKQKKKNWRNKLEIKMLKLWVKLKKANNETNERRKNKLKRVNRIFEIEIMNVIKKNKRKRENFKGNNGE